MSRRSPAAALVASPTMVGAVTTLIVIVAVFLAYNANQGLPFVPVYRVSVEAPNAARMTSNNEIRIGGTRVGVVESIEPTTSPSETETAQAGGGDEAGELAPVAARLNLKLDKTAEPLPQDSVFRVRYKSAFGLKYLEIVRGTGEPAPEGFVFDGVNDSAGNPEFVGCDLPTNPETFSEEIPEQAKDGCFQPQTEFDAIANTFDTRTRENIRESLQGYGNAFAGRGMSLNDAIENLGPLLADLRPVARVLADPETGFRRFWTELADTARIVAPVSEQQAQFFTNAAIAFAAFSADTEALKETISEGPETLRTAIDTLPRQRPFLAELAELSSRLRPGVQQLRVALPSLNRAISVGTPVLARTPAFNRDLRGVLTELRRLVDQETTKLSLVRLRDTLNEAQPLLRWVVPAQTVCNYFNYWFTNFPAAFSEDSIGYSLRNYGVSPPMGEVALGPLPALPGMVETPLGGYSGWPANGKAGALEGPPYREFRPRELPIAHAPVYNVSGQAGREFPDCQPGQVGYPVGYHPALRAPGQAEEIPGMLWSDMPGSAGATTVWWGQDHRRSFVDTRVQSRQPQ